MTTFVDDADSTTSSSTTGGGAAGVGTATATTTATAATTAAAAAAATTATATGRLSAAPERLTLPAATAAAAAVSEDSWFDDNNGWHGFDTSSGTGYIGGYDLENGETQGGMYGGGGGGKEVASYMRWGAEGGVWYGDGYRGGRDGTGGDGEDGQWGAQLAGGPARWSGISEIGAGVMRPADALGTGLEEHLPFMVTHTLVKVLRDPLLSAHYQVCVCDGSRGGRV